MISDLDGGDPAPRRAASVPLILVALLAILLLGVDARAGGELLVLPPAAPDVELATLPDRLANEPPPATLRLPVPIRGTIGIASDAPPWTVLWTERGTSYRLSSWTHDVGTLVRLAETLR